jgi:hypothetical protein
MFHEDDHPDTNLSDWMAFNKDFSPYLIEEVVDRSELNLVDWFVPLARGVAIASPALLRRAGYLPGMDHRPGWRELQTGIFKRAIDLDTKLMVRTFSNRGLWTIEHIISTAPFAKTLVFLFGSTPIVAGNLQSATYLADLCLQNAPASLRWIKTSSSDHQSATKFALKRRFDEIDAQLASKTALRIAPTRRRRYGRSPEGASHV